MGPDKSIRDAETVREFRAFIIRFANARAEAMELRRYFDQETGNHRDPGVQPRHDRIVGHYGELRQEISSRLQVVTAICHHHSMPYELIITPPPMLGGYVQSMNVFQAFIELELPHGLEVPPQKVIDLLDQTIYSCENVARHAMENPSSKLKPVGGALSKTYEFLFRSDSQKSALGWGVIALIVAGVLRLLGFNLADTVKMLFDLWKK